MNNAAYTAADNDVVQQGITANGVANCVAEAASTWQPGNASVVANASPGGVVKQRTFDENNSGTCPAKEHLAMFLRCLGPCSQKLLFWSFDRSRWTCALNVCFANM